MFAIQHQGWCASARFAYRTYRKYGTSSKCRNGKGGPWANSVYILRGKEITTTLITQGSREAKTKINLFTLNIKMLNFLCSRQHYVYLSSYKKSVLNQSAHVFALGYWVIDELFMSLRILYEYQKNDFVLRPRFLSHTNNSQQLLCIPVHLPRQEIHQLLHCQVQGTSMVRPHSKLRQR